LQTNRGCAEREDAAEEPNAKRNKAGGGRGSVKGGPGGIILSPWPRTSAAEEDQRREEKKVRRVKGGERGKQRVGV